jgi:hypothetical protein
MNQTLCLNSIGKAFCFLFLIGLFSSRSEVRGAGAEHRFFVSPQGNDQKKGTTEGEAFRNLERAREEIRLLRAKDKAARVVVELLPGTYPMEKTFLLEKQDGGTEGNRVIYRSRDRQKACLIGGRTFRLSEFQPVSAQALLLPCSIFGGRRITSTAVTHGCQSDFQKNAYRSNGTIVGICLFLIKV